MSRKHNRKRRQARRERKVAYQEARKAFEERFPNRGLNLGPTMLNFIAQARGMAYAQRRCKEAWNPLNYDNILMERKRALLDEFNRHNNWRKSIDEFPPGWERDELTRQRHEALASEELTSEEEEYEVIPFPRKKVKKG